jgi:hypothetical protein
LELNHQGYYGSTDVTISDSKSNTWTPLTSHARNRIYFAAAPTVGSSHNLTATSTGAGNDYPSFCWAAFSGTQATWVFDYLENGNATPSATSLNTGSLTPSQDNELVIAALSDNGTGTGRSINNSFTIIDQIGLVASQHFGGGLAYKVQTATTAVDAAWSWSSALQAFTSITAFRESSSFIAETYRSGTSWTVPGGVTSVRVRIWAGGGSGGGYNCCATGGGGGGFSERTTKSVTPGATISYTVGAGGAAPGNTVGNAGVGSTADGMTANPGLGGNTTIVGYGGTASGGDINITGTAGSNYPGGGNGGNGGAGAGPTGSGGGGGGGFGAITTTVALIANSPGGGGGGASSAVPAAASAGASGQIEFAYTPGGGGPPPPSSSLISHKVIQ